MALSRALRCCQRIFSWIPVIIISSVVLWSYYAYVFELCFVVYLLIFHVCFIMFCWTYWKAIFTPPSTPTKKFHLSYTDKERYEMEERPDVQKQILIDIAKKLPIFTRAQSGGTQSYDAKNLSAMCTFAQQLQLYNHLAECCKWQCLPVKHVIGCKRWQLIVFISMSSAIRFCDRCQVIKPDRCHHCSVCETCVLKMDHHCPWVNNCVGFSNYKFFLLFLSYSMIYCVFIASTVFQYFLKYWVGDLPNGPAKFHVLFLLFVALMFFVSLLFLFGYHCWLVAKNRSTLEAFSAPVFQNGPDRNGFNVGLSRNLQQVFGEDKKLWFIPVFTSQGDGHYFPLRTLRESENPLLANEGKWMEDGGSDEESSDEILAVSEDLAHSPTV
ncbi:palmitoyltransferase ZDHHC15 [Labeo rohita]|uniref:Palmitoyltransferase n=2 Tax=Labeo rohita TaxID=84645 RepID=A0A498MZN1_LABRO|nr:palmitoyltransferase ZDHHC15 [Labeo rohita]RXN33793.1 palmitoyltransferase ZDHHC15 [Labeo rohita]